MADIFELSERPVGSVNEVRRALNAPTQYRASDITEKESVASQLGTTFGQVDASGGELQQDALVRNIERNPKAQEWVAKDESNIAYLKDDPALATMYDDLEAAGVINSHDVDRDEVSVAGEAGADMRYAWARGNIQIEQGNLAHRALSGEISLEEFRAQAEALNKRMEAVKGGGDFWGIYGAIEQLPRMLSVDLPAMAEGALQYGMAGGTVGTAVGTVSGPGAVVTGATGTAVGMTYGALAGGFKASERSEAGSLAYDLLMQKDDAGQYVNDLDAVRFWSHLYGMGSAAIETGSDYVFGKILGVGGAMKKAFGLDRQIVSDAVKAAAMNKSIRPIVTSFMKGGLEAGVTEGTEEGMQQLLQNIVTSFVQNSLNDDGANYWRERSDPFSGESMREVGEAAWSAFKMGPWFYLLPGGIKAASQSRAAMKAADWAESNKTVADKIQESTELKKSPVRLESFLQTMGMDGNVLIPADAAWQMQQGGTDICSLLGWEQSSLEEAAALGHEMSMPLARVHARLAQAPDVMKQVADIMRESPDAMSAVEASEVNEYLDMDLDAIADAAEKDGFERSAIEAEVERLRGEIEGAIRSIPSYMAQIASSADPEMTVRQIVDDSIKALTARASILQRRGSEGIADFLGRITYQGLVKDQNGRWVTPDEAEQNAETLAQREAVEPFWETVWGRLDRDSLKADFPDAARELVRQHGKGIFGKKDGSVAVDELADELKRKGLLPEDATDSDLIDKLKEMERPTWRGKKGRRLNQEAIDADQRLADDMAAWSKTIDAFSAGTLDTRKPVQVMSKTPLVLSLLGADKDLPIVTDYGKLKKILKDKHKLPESVLKQVPAAMADPIMIFESATIKGDYVMMLDLKDEDGATVVVPVSLNYEHGKGYVVNYMPSVYGQKDENGKPKNVWFLNQISNGNLRYKNNKKSRQWMSSSRLQLPWVGSSIGGKKKVLSEQDFVNARLANPGYYQFIGERGAASMDAEYEQSVLIENLGVANEMEKAGKTPSEIKMATGWERGKDDKWRYEIDDSSVTVFPDGDADARHDPAYARKMELSDRSLEPDFTAEEEAEFESLIESTPNTFDLSDAVDEGTATLKDIIDAPELFSAYPQLKEYKVKRERNLESGDNGFFSSLKNEIHFSAKLHGNNLKSTLLHEIQHAIQDIEGFTGGASSSSYESMFSRWNDQIRRATEYIDQLLKSDREYQTKVQQSTMDLLAKKKTPDEHFADLKRYEEESSNAEAIKNARNEIKRYEQQREDTFGSYATNAFSAYLATAGEVEARNVSRRMRMTPEQRRNSLAESSEDVARSDQIRFYQTSADGKKLSASEADSQARLMSLMQIAYHGTPHKFDKFTLDHIGEGEGNQAHGWGLYFAQDRAVSQDYHDTLTYGNGVVLYVNGKEYRRTGNAWDGTESWVDGDMNPVDEMFYDHLGRLELKAQSGKIDSDYVDAIHEWMQNEEYTDEQIDILKNMLDEYENAKLEIESNGQLFRVDIPDSDVMLDEDLSISEQPQAVQDALRKLGFEGRDSLEKRISDLQKRVSDAKAKYDEASKAHFEKSNALVGDDDLFAYMDALYEDTQRAKSDQAYLAAEKELESAEKELDEANKLKAFMDGGDYDGDMKGWQIRGKLEQRYGSPKAASEAMNKAGIKGITYDGRRDGRCFVVFDDKSIQILEAYYQNSTADAQGMVTPTDDGRYVIQLFGGADISTIAHETSHVFFLDMQRRVLEGSADAQMQKDWKALQDWLGQLDDDKILKQQYDLYASKNEAFAGRKFEELNETEKGLAKQIAGQEMLARGWEQYLREGKAPSSRLDGFFRRMGKWMKKVYQAATMLHVELTDEVRDVFDRMIAADDEMDNVAEAANIREETSRLMDTLGLKGKARLEIEGLITDAKEEAAEKLRTVRDSGRRERMARWMKDAKAIVEEEQGYVMAKMLKATPLSWADLVDVVGEDRANALSKRFPGTVKRDGDVEPEMFAYEHGYSGAAEMVQDMLSKPSKKERVKELVERMQKDYDETFDADSYLWEQDQIAMQQELIAKALEQKIADITAKARYDSELAGRTVGGEEVTPTDEDYQDFGSRARWRVGKEQLKRQAEAFLGKQRMNDAVKPENYRRMASRWINEERRAILSGNWQKAMEANYKARINIELARQSADLRDRHEKLQRNAKRFLDMDLKGALRGMSDSDIRALQGARVAIFQLARITNLISFSRKAIANADRKGPDDVRHFLKVMGEEGLLNVVEDNGDVRCSEIATGVFDKPMPWETATVEEWQDYYEAMSIIMHVDKVFRKGTTEANAQNWQERMQAVVDSIYANNKTRQRHPYENHNRKTIGSLLREIHAGHLKAETIVLLFDGDTMGHAFDEIIRPINRADDTQKRRLLKERVAVKKLFSVYSRKELVAMKSKPVFVDEIGMSLTKEQALACLLNFGNDSNAERLMKGFVIKGKPITMAQLLAVFDTILDERDFRFAQSVWDYFETFKKESFDLEESITGVRPKSVEARPLKTKYGTFRGGYYPVVYDKTLSALPIDTETIGTQTGSMFASVDHGSMKARSATGLGKSLSLSIDVIPSHVARTVHMLAFRKPVIEVARVLNNKEIMSAIENTVGPEQAKALKNWLHYVAGERPAKDGWSKAAGWARKNAALFMMGYKMTTVLAQSTGMLATVAEIGPKWALIGLAQAARGRMGAYRFACDMSPMMATRLKSIDREVFEMSTKLMDTGSKYAALDPAVRVKTLVEDHAYDIMGWWQMICADLPTWLGAYQKGLAENGGNMEAAREYADSILGRTQVGGADKDLAGVQRGAELGKLMTMFYSYFSALYQLSARRITMLNRRRDAASAFRFATLAMLTWFAEPVLAGMILRKDPGEDDDDSWASWAVGEAFKNPFNMVIGVRDIAGMIDGMISGFNRGFKLSSSLDVFDSFGKFGTQIYKALDTDKDVDVKKLTLSGAKAFGQASGGLINAQEIRLIEAFWDWLDGTKPEFELMDLVRKKQQKK